MTGPERASQRAAHGPPVRPRSLASRASRALPWLFLLYAAASLTHFTHNAEYLHEYPNLPAFSRGQVYAAWCVLSAAGVLGFLRYRAGSSLGLVLLGGYGVLGFAGLLHYTRAPFSGHTAGMNLTICTEVAAAALLLADVLVLAARRRAIA